MKIDVLFQRVRDEKRPVLGASSRRGLFYLKLQHLLRKRRRRAVTNEHPALPFSQIRLIFFFFWNYY